MIETITKEIDGMKFHIQQFPALKSIRLEKKTLTLLSPVIQVIKGIKGKKTSDILDSEIDLSFFAKIIQEFLTELDEDVFINYLKEMIACTAIQITKENNSQPQMLNKEEIIDVVFVGKSLTLYKLLIEVMRANNFAFFELVVGGGLKKIGTLIKQK